MSEGKASTRAKNRYNEKAYDRLNLVVPKGRKAVIQAAADGVGQSLNGFVVQAIDERLERIGAGDDNPIQPKTETLD